MMTYTTVTTVAVRAVVKRALKRKAIAICTLVKRTKKMTITAGCVYRKRLVRRAAPKTQTRRRKQKCRAK